MFFEQLSCRSWRPGLFAPIRAEPLGSDPASVALPRQGCSSLHACSSFSDPKYHPLWPSLSSTLLWSSSPVLIIPCSVPSQTIFTWTFEKLVLSQQDHLFSHLPGTVYGFLWGQAGKENVCRASGKGSVPVPALCVVRAWQSPSVPGPWPS